MSFAPPESKSKDDGPSLLCSVNGCGNLWSVRMEGSSPKCSHHQWGEKKVKRDVASLLRPKHDQWYDNESF